MSTAQKGTDGFLKAFSEIHCQGQTSVSSEEGQLQLEQAASRRCEYGQCWPRRGRRLWGKGSGASRMRS